MESTLYTSQDGGQQIYFAFYPKRDLCLEKNLMRRILFLLISGTPKPLVAQKEHPIASRTSQLLLISFIVLTIHFRTTRADQGKAYSILFFAYRVCTTVNKLSRIRF